jgi:signal transduction histidine kinase
MAASVISDGTLPSEAATDAVNILLVDDQPARLVTYRAILSDLRENLIDASSGAEALKLLMTHDFAVILLDVNMPGMDGFETASLIHEHPRFENTPIIFVTAINVSDLDRMRGYRLGAFDYVMVPIIPEILRSKVIALVELYRKRRDLELANRHLATANEALVAEKARELAGLNESLRRANIELGKRNAELQVEIAERMRAEAQLIEQDRRKDEFLAMLAHELRNPLASVSNAVAAFKLSTPSPHPLHEAMGRQVGLLVRLIDDLLDVARIRRGKLALKQGHTTLNAMIDSAIETVSPMFKKGEYALKVTRLPSDVLMYADHQRLSQVFSNLLSNAAKYSDPGSAIDVSLTRQGEWIEIAVVDRGIGLTSDQQDWIFELFAQVDTTLARSRGGLGIGLTLARHIVEMHGGQLLVSSEGIGRGSTFIVRLKSEADSLPLKPDDVLQPAGVACRALIVDDNADSADTMAMLLQLLGHDVQCIYDSHRVLDTVDSFAPDIVFLDIGMPGLSGYDVARLLRTRPDGEKLILVALTGWGQPEDRRRTAEAGFDHHLVKPTDVETIQRVCNTLTARVRATG